MSRFLLLGILDDLWERGARVAGVSIVEATQRIFGKIASCNQPRKERHISSVPTSAVRPTASLAYDDLTPHSYNIGQMGSADSRRIIIQCQKNMLCVVGLLGDQQ